MCLPHRFFYTFRGDHKDHPYPFSEEQLSIIKRRTLSDIICDNTDLPFVPENPFWIGTEKV